MVIREVGFASDHYEAMKRFREETSRLPLGLVLRPDDVRGENAQIHIAAFHDDGKVIGTVLLKPLFQERVKLRQMALSPALRRTGIGRRLNQFAEASASAQGFRSIELNARVYARGFYERLGYRTVGDVFLEVTLPTIKMLKVIAG